MLIINYLKEIQKRFESGISTEHSYRIDLQNLIAGSVKEIIITNEPKRQQCGAPDYIIQKKDAPIGYIEAKDIGVDLDKTEKTEQLKRYLPSLNNLILTDYLEFRFYRYGIKTQTVKLGELENNKIKILEENFESFIVAVNEFCLFKGQTIKSSKRLAEIMAQKARLMKEVIFKVVSEPEETNTLIEQLKAFRRILITNLGEQAFADIYAQTIAYGLFAARLNDFTPDNFSRQEALFLVPKSNPFLRQLFTYVAGPELDFRVEWIVNDLADSLKCADIKSIIADFGKTIQLNDPFLHFYETFLAEYDSTLRKLRGVYYTPEPVVSFIVDAVDEILKTEFKITDGLADARKIEIDIEKTGNSKKIKEKIHKIQILDPATGTGTFLAEIVKHIYKNFESQKGAWSGYAQNDLIPRLNGFEILMAPYTMCHLKLEMLLRSTGYQINDQNQPPRLRVFLTNSLEEAHPDTGSLFASWLANEANEANLIKRDTPVMVVLGNPPYSGVSLNMKEWITSKIEDYKYIDGEHFAERKHWLQDDYVKFIRYGELFIEKNGEGILAFINNHSFLDNPTFRGMRWHLLNTFDKIYIIDLHGNAKKKEVSPDGSKDENVFDIQQGVSINIFVKTKNKSQKNKLAEVFMIDLFGSREYKYNYLADKKFSAVKFKKIKYQEPYYFFTTKNYSNRAEYEKGFAVNELFQKNTTGIVTMGDSFIIADTKEELKQRLTEFLSSDITESSLKNKFGLGKNYAKWILENKKQIVLKDENFIQIDYRPFDRKWTYYDNKLIWRWRYDTFQNFFKGDNIGIIFHRREELVGQFAHIFISNTITEHGILSSKTTNTEAPLFIYNGSCDQQSLLFSEEHNRAANMDIKILNQFENKLGLKFSVEKTKKKNTFAAIDVFDYIYTVLHSPAYRKKYNELLKIDFPRIPYPQTVKQFFEFVKFGEKLRKLHLLEDLTFQKFITEYPEQGDNIITKMDFKIIDAKKKLGRLWINEKQYFDKIPVTAWEYYIGGYQPAQKWLKDRRNKELSKDDIFHYQKIIIALTETDKLSKEIDNIKY